MVCFEQLGGGAGRWAAGTEPLPPPRLRPNCQAPGAAVSRAPVFRLRSALEAVASQCSNECFGKRDAHMTNRVALITGVTGQDGAYLAEFLLKKGYTVHGIKRRSSSFNTGRVHHLYQDPHEGNPRFALHYGDLTDATNLIRIIQEVQPSELYNLAAQSHVQVSFETPEYTANADALGPLRLLEAIQIGRASCRERG